MATQDLAFESAVVAHPGWPRGWYALAFSSEVGPGELRTVAYLGREYVLWRGQSGVLSAMEPYCPHLGAHLGHGGEVVGDAIRCPMHHFRFGAEGSCVSTGYGAQSAPKGRARTLPVIEQAGLVLVAHGVDVPLPVLPGGLPVQATSHRGAASVLSIAGRLSALYPASAVSRVETLDVEVDENAFRSRQRWHFEAGIFEQRPELAELRTTLHGPGLGTVEISTGDSCARMLVALGPVGPNETEIRVIQSMEEPADTVSRLFPRQVRQWVVQAIVGGASVPSETFRTWARRFGAPESPRFEVLPAAVACPGSCA